MTGPRLSIIPARACTDPALKPRDLQVLCVLGRHTDDLGWCSKSQVKMAREMDCARSTVFEAIKRLKEAGYLEEHVQPQDNGRDAPHLYRVILDPKHPDPGSIPAEPDDGDDADTPADQPAPPAGISAPPAGPGPAPKNDPSRTKERERARAVDKDDLPAGEQPGTAEFEKRVMRFCNGTGYLAGPWQDWDTTSPSWIAAKMASLSVDDRAAAEQWRDAYLLDIRDRKAKPMPVGVWLRDRAWLALDPAILQRAEKLKQAKLAPEERARPEGWAACLGPVGMAWLFDALIEGTTDPETAARPFLSDAMLRDAWPRVWWFEAHLRQRGGAMFDRRWHDLKTLMEPVPKASAVLADWRLFFKQNGWRWLAAFDRADVVYCPKGGPDAGMRAFAAALQSFEETREGKTHDGGGRQAAE